MDITLTDTLSLVAVLALLMVNFASRRIAAAQATRGLVKDHIKGTRHQNHDKTLLALRGRLTLLTAMLLFSALGALFAFVAAACVVFEWDSAAKAFFVMGIFAGIICLAQSVRESGVANRSHFNELDSTVSKDDPYYATSQA